VQVLTFLACIRQVPDRNFGLDAGSLRVFFIFIFSRRVLVYYCLLGNEHFLPRRFQFPVIHYFEGMYYELTDISKPRTKFIDTLHYIYFS